MVKYPFKNTNARIETIHEKPSFRDAQLNGGIYMLMVFLNLNTKTIKVISLHLPDYPIGLGIISEFKNTKLEKFYLLFIGQKV